MSPAKKSMITVMRPDFNRGNGYRSITIRDYVLVPRLDTYETFKFQDIISFEDLGKLATLYYNLDKPSHIRM